MQTFINKSGNEVLLAAQLFREEQLSQLLTRRRQDLEREARALPGSAFNESCEHVCDSLFDKIAPKPLSIDWRSATLMPWEDNGPAEFRFRYFFSGTPELFWRQPDWDAGGCVCGQVLPGDSKTPVHLVIPIRFPEALKTDQDKEKARDALMQKFDRILHVQRGQIEAWKKETRVGILQMLESRSAACANFQRTAKALKIPIASRPGILEPPPTPIPLKPVRTSAQPDERCISDGDYDRILSVIRAAGSMFERAPATFAKLDEEELRDVINAMLNTHYVEMVDGESFRASGKTDIQVKFEGKAAFVGECKVWNGPTSLTGAIDQLLAYLTWRDLKTSVIMFNTDRKGFKALQDKMAAAIQSHERCISPVTGIPPSEWRYQFSHPSDADRRVTVHVFVFDVQVRKSTL